MSKYQLTTAKMRIITEALFNERRIDFEYSYTEQKGRQTISDYNEVQRSLEKIMVEEISEGISEDVFFRNLRRLDFNDFEEGIESGRLLEKYMLDHEDYFKDRVPVNPISDFTDNLEPVEREDA